MGQETTLYIKEFWQEEFEGNEDRVLELEREISASRVTIGLSSGEMIVDVKKLNRTPLYSLNFLSELRVLGERNSVCFQNLKFLNWECLKDESIISARKKSNASRIFRKLES